MTAPAPSQPQPGPRRVTCFAGHRWLLAGSLAEVAVAVKHATAIGAELPVLIFDDSTGRVVDVDVRGGDDEVRGRYASPDVATIPPVPGEPESAPRRPGRPTLGVVGREVTLLPRHWEWLNAQPGGASVALRRLVDEARRVGVESERARMSRERAYHFLSAVAGDLPGYEEAVRALFADDLVRLRSLTSAWPRDVATYALHLASGD